MIRNLAISNVVGDTIVYDVLKFSRIYRTVPLNDIIRLFPPEDAKVKEKLIQKLEEKFGR